MDPLAISICCFALALGLAVLDLFLPSGGLLLILSAVAAIASVLFGFRSSTNTGMTVLTLLLIAVPVFTVVALRMWAHTPLGRMIVLQAPQQDASRDASVQDPLQEMVGRVGVALNAFMPSGHVRIDHRNYNAVAQQGVIEAGQTVEVVAVQERNLIVVLTDKPLRAPANVQPADDVNSSPESLLDRPADELGLDSLES